MTTYYLPLRDPISDAVPVSAGKDGVVILLFIDGEPVGSVSLKHAQLPSFLPLICERYPVAEIDLFEPEVHWLIDDYKKPHVVDVESGILVHVNDLP